MHLIGVDFLDGWREGRSRLVGSSCESALDVWDVRRLGKTELTLNCGVGESDWIVLYPSHCQEFCYRHPAFSNEHSATIPLVELVEDVVDRLHLANHHIVGPDGGRRRQQKPVPMLGGLAEHSVQVLDPGANPAKHVTSLHPTFRTSKDCRVKTLADLFHPHPQLFPLEENEEDALVKRVSTVRVDHLLLNVHELDEDIALGDPPEHGLKGEHPGPVQHSGSDVELKGRGGASVGSVFDVSRGGRVWEGECAQNI